MESREAAATHEAGHCVVAVVSGFTVLETSIEATEEWAGYTLAENPAGVPYRPIDWIAMYMAGFAALPGAEPARCEADVQFALDYLAEHRGVRNQALADRCIEEA